MAPVTSSSSPPPPPPPPSSSRLGFGFPMTSLRRRRNSSVERLLHDDGHGDTHEDQKRRKKREVMERHGRPSRCSSCFHSCCWLVGMICSFWWFLMFLYHAMPPSFPQYVTEAINGPLPDPPGVKLKKEGLVAKHPVVFVPGIVTGGLELWEGHQCADGLFRKRLWGGTFGEIYKRYGFSTVISRRYASFGV